MRKYKIFFNEKKQKYYIEREVKFLCFSWFKRIKKEESDEYGVGVSTKYFDSLNQAENYIEHLWNPPKISKRRIVTYIEYENP